jgi:hypothetical protein
MSQWPECDASLNRAHASGSDWNYCSVSHCDDLTNYNHTFCNCTGQFSVYPYVQNGICMTAPGSLIPITAESCYCCCSCLAYDTPVAVSKTEYKVVQDFQIGNPMLVATDASLKTWVQKPVKFSSGTGPNGKNKFIKIVFGSQATGIYVMPDSFKSRFVTAEESANYYKVLSTAPNNFIDNKGVVNLKMVMSTNPDNLARLLNARIEIAERIYDILDTNPNFLLVTGIQPFFMKDGTLKQASKLVPGKDTLVMADGSTTPIVSMEVGMFNKGVHHIATSQEAATSVDDHLMIAGGIVVGDYSAQLGLAAGTIKNSYNAHPDFGTKEYNTSNAHLNATHFSAYASAAKPIASKLSGIHHIDNSAIIPKDAFSYVTRSQAIELRDNAPIFPASNNVAEPDVRYLFRLFKAFYPEITFYYDQNNMLPNAYAFEQYGRKFVVLTVGWTMMDGIYFHGIAMTLSHMVNALTQTVPVDVSPVGKADYDVYPSFLGLFYFAPDALKNYNLAMTQIKTIFGYIKKHRKPIGKIGLNCRISTLEASINNKALPHCAGGPPDAALEVLSATATLPKGAETPVVTVTFNLPVDPETATLLGNYLLDPAATAFSATMDSTNPAKVNLSVDVLPDLEYYLVATGVLSTKHQPMVVGKNGAHFKLS